MQAVSTTKKTSYSPNVFGSLFSGLTNCTINFIPQSVTFNMQPQLKLDEFDDIVKDLDF